uniref:Uncharacterized protein n=1 Tax=Anguilla anguilla TaxID=7936 RepID=A0A0E9RWK1_ANGAN
MNGCLYNRLAAFSIAKQREHHNRQIGNIMWCGNPSQCIWWRTYPVV